MDDLKHCKTISLQNINVMQEDTITCEEYISIKQEMYILFMNHTS